MGSRTGSLKQQVNSSNFNVSQMLESKSNQRNLIGKKGILSKFKAIFLYTSSYFIIFSTVQLVEKDKQKTGKLFFLVYFE